MCVGPAVRGCDLVFKGGYSATLLMDSPQGYKHRMSSDGFKHDHSSLLCPLLVEGSYGKEGVVT